MTNTKPPKLSDLTHSLRLLGKALAETAALRSSLFLERLGLLTPPPPPKPARRHGQRRRSVH